MTLEMFLGALLIVFARVCDVSLGTIRTVCIVKNRRGLAFVLGFAESLIWIFVIAAVATNLSNPVYAVAYAFGFALGNFTGMTLEARIGLGAQVVRIFTRRSDELLVQLRLRGFKVTKFVGEGHSGAVDMLLLTLPRKSTKACLQYIAVAEPEAFFFVDDIAESYEPAAQKSATERIRSWIKKK